MKDNPDMANEIDTTLREKLLAAPNKQDSESVEEQDVAEEAPEAG